MPRACRFVLPLIAVLIAQSLAADSRWTRERILEERFSVEITIGPRHRVSSVSFGSSGGQSLQAAVVDQRAVVALGLKPGSSIAGSFRFSGLSGTDLGSGRVYSGRGTLTLDKVLEPGGGAAGCPPLCDDAVRLAVELRVPR